MGHYNSFIVKVWTDEATGKMRGHIQHVSSQESMHFITLDNMVDFILNHVGLHPRPDRGHIDADITFEADDEHS